MQSWRVILAVVIYLISTAAGGERASRASQLRRLRCQSATSRSLVLPHQTCFLRLVPELADVGLQCLLSLKLLTLLGLVYRVPAVCV